MSAELPASVTDLRVNLVGLAAMTAATGAVVWSPVSLDTAGLLLLASVAVPIALLEVAVRRVHRRASTGIDWARSGPVDLGRVGLRWLGAAGMVGAVLAFYFLTPEYQGAFYDPWYRLLWRIGPPGALLGLAYMAWIDGRLADPHDAYWHFGRVLTGRFEGADWARIADLARGWVVKGFFTPLMYVYLFRNVGQLRAILLHREPGWLALFDALWSFGFLVDVVFTTVGYLMTLRILDGHIRSAEPTGTGWIVAMLCYEPFWSVFSRQYIAYDSPPLWGEWLEPYPAAKFAWAVVLLLTLAVFSGSTVAFGYRFSNLTHRGVLTNGPYRFTKHPAYISKIVSFWMIFVPWVARGDAYLALRDCVWLGAISVVYFLRARTEERHLSRDPDYVRYALWMNDHGLLAPLGRLVPFLRYRPPA